MEACFHGNADIVRLYIEHNADINTQSGYGWTALHYAGQNIKKECVALLLAAGANKELKNSKGKNAAERASENEKEGIKAIRNLLEWEQKGTVYQLFKQDIFQFN